MSGVVRDAQGGSGAAILIVKSSRESAAAMQQVLIGQGLESEKASRATEAVELVKREEFDVVVLDAKMRDITGVELLKIVKAFHPETEVVVLDATPSVNLAVISLSAGAYDYLVEPLDANRLILSVRGALTKKALNAGDKYAVESGQKGLAFNGIVGGCDRMKEIFRLIEKVGPSMAPVIIQGESGTGKELVAIAIHQTSRRKNRKFLAINSASLPETLLESELFGYRRGAFTGADKDKVGLLESADGGSILLDEIGSMSRQLQGKLLRAMEEGEILPVGSSERVKIDVRFLAASNRDLWEMVASGEFRRELYYRLNVIEITLPPLRERKEDIPLLAEHFLDKHCQEHRVERKSLGRPALAKLLNYRWPGNVRELENVIRRAVIVSKRNVIQAREIDLKGTFTPHIAGRTDLLSMPYRQAKRVMESEFQRAYLKRLLSESGGNMAKAAKRAGLSRQAVHEMTKRCGLK
jgi:DNA-binding NtrC family response regulator